jgi:small conductance mechanosensitive channel
MMSLDQLDFEKYLGIIVHWLITFSPKVILAGIIAYFGLKVIKSLSKVTSEYLLKAKIGDEVAIFLANIIDVALKVILVLICASVLGVGLTSVVGILAAAGFAVGLALQGFLGNFASGLTIIFFKPYQIGDWVNLAGTFGKVKSIQIFNTILITPGEKTIIIPNGKVTDSVMTNLSTQSRMRLELKVYISYEEDFPTVKSAIESALLKCHTTMKDEKAEIGIENFDATHFTVTVRPFIHPDQYWNATFQVLEEIKKEMHYQKIKIYLPEGGSSITVGL